MTINLTPGSGTLTYYLTGGWALDESSDPAILVMSATDGALLYWEYASVSTPTTEAATLGNTSVNTRIRDVATNGAGRFLAVTDGGNVLISTDGAQNWTLVNVGTTYDLYKVGFMSSNAFVVVGDHGVCYYTTDGGFAWTSIATGVTDDLRGLCVATGYVVTVGKNGRVLRIVRATPTTLTTVASNAVTGTPDLYAVATDSTTYIAVGETGSLFSSTNATSWSAETTGVSGPISGVATDGSNNWIACGAAGSSNFVLSSTAPTTTWTLYSDNFSDGSALSVVYGGTSGTVIRFLLIGAAGIAYINDPTPEPNDLDTFVPLSDIYRSKACAVVANRVHLFGVSEWDSTTNTFVYSPRKSRWTAPGTYADFSGTGSGYQEWSGGGEFLQSCVIGNDTIVSETNQIAVFQLGSVSTYTYRGIYGGDNISALSNMVVLAGEAWFVARNGRLYSASSVKVAESSAPFDLTEFEDFSEADPDPVWLRANSELGMLLIFRPASPYDLHVIDPLSGSYTSWRLPYVTVSGFVWSPVAVDSVRTPGGDFLQVAYKPDGGVISTLVVSVFDFGAAVRGTDVVNGETAYFHADHQTGLYAVANDGHKLYVHEIEFETACPSDTSTPPDVLVQFRSTEEAAWREPVGTVSLSSTTATVSGGCWAADNDIEHGTVIGASADTGTAFDVPCHTETISSLQYRNTSTLVFTELASTAWSITDADSIALASAKSGGNELWAFWSGWPKPLQAQDCYIEDDNLNLHRITDVTRYNQATVTPGITRSWTEQTWEAYPAGTTLNSLTTIATVLSEHSPNTLVVADNSGDLSLQHPQYSDNYWTWDEPGDLSDFDLLVDLDCDDSYGCQLQFRQNGGDYWVVVWDPDRSPGLLLQRVLGGVVQDTYEGSTNGTTARKVLRVYCYGTALKARVLTSASYASPTAVASETWEIEQTSSFNATTESPVKFATGGGSGTGTYIRRMKMQDRSDTSVESGGTLIQAKQASAGDGKLLTFGVGEELEEVQVRARLVCRDSATSPTWAAILGYKLVVDATGEEERE